MKKTMKQMITILMLLLILAIPVSADTVNTDTSNAGTENLETTTEKEQVTVQIPQPSAKAQKFLNALEKYSKKMEEDAAKGKFWIYSNSGVPSTYKNGLRGNRKCNCGLLAAWGLKEVGILKASQSFYGDPHGALHFSSSAARNRVKKYCRIIKVKDTAANLVAQGNLVPGDIISFDFGKRRHTSIFQGYSPETGTYHFYDAGRNNQGCKSRKGVYKFFNLHYDVTDLNRVYHSKSGRIGYIIRIK